ncbi:MAG: hypothetical protein KatS3mg102_0096 [Planctomycetota bacterium]|nr:MAG: hypothetical protein KatS3mg102_0096 [Planctomycetota bacterium]
MPAPMPTLHALLICDLVLREAVTNKHSAIGIFTDVHTTKLPMVLNPLAVYASLTDALGSYELALELEDLENGQLVARVSGLRLESRDKLATHDFGIRLVNTVFPRASRYEFRLLVDGRLLGARTLRVHERPLPGGIAPASPPAPEVP